MDDVQTCAASLMHAGRCCTDDCDQAATLAVLDSDMIEHARCAVHAASGWYTAEPLGMKPLVWAPAWAPE